MVENLQPRIVDMAGDEVAVTANFELRKLSCVKS
jgi:hypothetical protein